MTDAGSKTADLDAGGLPRKSALNSVSNCSFSEAAEAAEGAAGGEAEGEGERAGTEADAEAEEANGEAMPAMTAATGVRVGLKRSGAATEEEVGASDVCGGGKGEE